MGPIQLFEKNYRSFCRIPLPKMLYGPETWRHVAIMSTNGRIINNCKRRTVRMLGTIRANTKGISDCSKAFNFVLP